MKHFDPHSIIKSIWIPPHENQVNFDPDTKTKWFSTPTQKPSQCWSLHWNQLNFDHPHTTQVNFDNHTNQVIFGPHTKPRQFQPPTQKQGNRSQPHSVKLGFPKPPVFLVSHAVSYVYSPEIRWISCFTCIRYIEATAARIAYLPEWCVWLADEQHLSLLYGMVTVPTLLGPMPAPLTFHDSFGRAAKFRKWSILHWGGEAQAIPY